MIPDQKCDRDELYDRISELEQLHKNIDKNTPLTLLTGIRRIGKTSLLCVFINEIGIPYLLIDARNLPANYGLRDLYGLLSKSMSNKKFLDKMKDVLGVVSGIKVTGIEVELSWRGRESISLGTLFDYMNKRKVLIAIDEAQALRGPRGELFLKALAHAYDYDRNIMFILTGSEVGLLYDYLDIENPDSPLYGRYINVITLERFTEAQSVDFLRKGLMEAGITPPIEYVRSIVEVFDGIPGWLTIAGNYIVTKSKLVDIDHIEEYAINIAIREIMKLEKTHGSRLIRTLKLLAQGHNSWTRLKKALEENEGKTVSKSSLSRIIRTLEKLSIIENYEFLDPIYKKASERILVQSHGD
ncbi:MAG: ATP-binding protein [Desulfurococcales archaeon]|nr:ATP-binding protein [Desulfurococcales archaeon]